MRITILFFTIVVTLGMPLKAGAEESRVVVVLGDSLSAGYGIDVQKGWVEIVGKRLIKRDPPWRIVNASVSGDTTDSGLIRLPGILERHKPDVVVLELGANDGLRGQAPARIRANLDTLITRSQAADARVVLAGIRLPPNYGPRYLTDFERMFKELATQYGLDLVPFLLEGVAGRPEFMQADGLHPTEDAQLVIADNVWPVLVQSLENSPKSLP